MPHPIESKKAPQHALICIAGPSNSGKSTLAGNLVKKYADYGANVTIFTPHPGMTEPTEVSGRTVTMHPSLYDGNVDLIASLTPTHLEQFIIIDDLEWELGSESIQTISSILGDSNTTIIITCNDIDSIPKSINPSSWAIMPGYPKTTLNKIHRRLPASVGAFSEFERTYLQSGQFEPYVVQE